MASYEKYLLPEVLQKVTRLDLRAKFLVEGFLSGLHESPYKGFSVEFSDHRKYVPGDALKLIDWKVYGKTDRYYIKRFQAETNMECHLFLDRSGSMAFRPRTLPHRFMTKFEYATAIAAALGYLMITQQDSVGLVTFDESIREYVRPRSKRTHLGNILSILSNCRPEGLTDVSGSIHKAASLLKKRGLVVVLSDLLDDPDAIENALAHLVYRGHDVIVFHIFDAAETNFPYKGGMEFEDPETGARLKVDADAVRADYLEAISAFVADIRRRCRLRGVDYVQLDTSVAFDQALVSFLSNRKRNFL
ncbi:MAG: DUF58 domain-containing protein [Planctomycetes bacterium]|nr:DUF58 domain-containing protein [Planctomycetota bacterium]